MLLEKNLSYSRALAAFFIICVTLCTISQGKLLWWDGSTTPETSAPGKLLSDNEDYWGDVVLTGVTYRYDGPAPDRPADNRVDRNGRTGRVLIDGNPDKTIGLSSSESPLVVVFDFNRICTFTEWDICLPTPSALAIDLEIGTVDGDESIIWQRVFTRSLNNSIVSRFFRIPLKSQPSGRYVRVTVQHVIDRNAGLGRCAGRRYGQRSLRSRH